MEDRYIPKIANAELLHGEYYAGRCRNARIARWNAETQRFVHQRHKCGFVYTEEICHPDDEQYFDVFVVEARCEPEKEIPFD